MIKVYKIIELIGDGISKEITQQATKILRVIEKENKHINFNIEQLPIGYNCYKKYEYQ